MTRELRPADWFPLPVTAGGDHHAELARRRRDSPVECLAPTPGAGVFVVYRYADVVTVLTDPRFSTEVVEERYGAVLGRSLVTLAPPARRAIRSVLLDVLRSDTPPLAAVVDAVVASRVDSLEAALGSGAVDVVPTLAAEVPARVLAVLLGLPEDDWAEVAALAAAAARLLQEPRAALRASRALRRRLASRLGERETAVSPTGRSGVDLVGALAEVQVDGQRLDDRAVVSSLLLLCWAGTETAFPAIATALYAVLTQPGAAEPARSAPGGALDVADEALRWEAPVQVTSRRVTREVELAGRTLPPGAIVLAHLGSANRDEREFADPDRFDAHRFDSARADSAQAASGRADSGRGPARHLAFGSGPHRCLGWQLARAEVAACVTAVLTRLPGLRLAAGSPPPEGAVVRSPRRLLVELS